jgi:hypothetical protein
LNLLITKFSVELWRLGGYLQREKDGFPARRNAAVGLSNAAGIVRYSYFLGGQGSFRTGNTQKGNHLHGTQ